MEFVYRKNTLMSTLLLHLIWILKSTNTFSLPYISAHDFLFLWRIYVVRRWPWGGFCNWWWRAVCIFVNKILLKIGWILLVYMLVTIYAIQVYGYIEIAIPSTYLYVSSHSLIIILLSEMFFNFIRKPNLFYTPCDIDEDILWRRTNYTSFSGRRLMNCVVVSFCGFRLTILHL